MKIFLPLLLTFFSYFVKANPTELLAKIKGHDAVLVFYRPNCPFCRHLMPLLEEVEQGKRRKSILFLKENTISLKDLNDYKDVFHFQTVPTVIYYKKGKEIRRHDSKNRTITKKEMIRYLHELD